MPAFPTANGLGLPLTQGPAPNTIGVAEIFAVAGAVFARLNDGTVVPLAAGSAPDHGIAHFLGAGVFNLVVPAGVTQMFYTAAAAGSGGGDHDGVNAGGGGAGGQALYLSLISVVPGETLTITNGAGGVAGGAGGTGLDGGTGGNTAISGSASGLIATLFAGNGGFGATAGGAGGGALTGAYAGQSAIGTVPGFGGGNAAAGIGGSILNGPPATNTSPINGGGGFGGSPATLFAPSAGANGHTVLQW